MRDIKTRESRAGSVKTIDRASMISYRMKQATIRGKELAGNYTDYGDQNATSYAEDNTFAIAEDAVYAGGSAAKRGMQGAGKLAKNASFERKNADNVNLAYEMGRKRAEEKAISYRRNTGTVTDDVSNVSGVKFGGMRNGGRVMRRASDSKPASVMAERNTAGRAVSPAIRARTVEKTIASGTNITVMSKEKAETVLKRQYKVKKATVGMRKKAEKAGKGFLVAVRRAVTSSRMLVGSLSVAGSVALIAIIVCTFFGSAFYILGDESNPDYIPGEFVGVGNEAIVEVAAQQVGNVGGGPYWSWYGFYDRVEWCACFVSWCAHKCGYIEDGIIPKFAVVGHGMSWFKNRDQWQGRGYHPKPGDIIFFDWDGDGLGNHVGIVESSDDTYVYTIEGNSGDRCRRRTYFISSSMIMGYGIPAYPAPEAVDPDENIKGKM